MNVTCPHCQRRYDDEFSWTLCPHDPLGSARGSYCREHDLFDCFLCANKASAITANTHLEMAPLQDPFMGIGGGMSTTFANKPIGFSPLLTLEKLQETLAEFRAQRNDVAQSLRINPLFWDAFVLKMAEKGVITPTDEKTRSRDALLGLQVFKDLTVPMGRIRIVYPDRVEDIVA